MNTWFGASSKIRKPFHLKFWRGAVCMCKRLCIHVALQQYSCLSWSRFKLYLVLLSKTHSLFLACPGVATNPPLSSTYVATCSPASVCQLGRRLSTYDPDVTSTDGSFHCEDIHTTRVSVVPNMVRHCRWGGPTVKEQLIRLPYSIKVTDSFFDVYWWPFCSVFTMCAVVFTE